MVDKIEKVSSKEAMLLCCSRGSAAEMNNVASYVNPYILGALLPHSNEEQRADSSGAPWFVWLRYSITFYSETKFHS